MQEGTVALKHQKKKKKNFPKKDLLKPLNEYNTGLSVNLYH